METVLNELNFEKEVKESELPYLVDFWASWCGPCQIMEPVVAQIAEEHEGKIKVGKVNVDENPNTAAQYGIRSIPTILLFKNGKNVGQLVGNVPKQMIEEFIKRN